MCWGSCVCVRSYVHILVWVWGYPLWGVRGWMGCVSSGECSWVISVRTLTRLTYSHTHPQLQTKAYSDLLTTYSRPSSFRGGHGTLDVFARRAQTGANSPAILQSAFKSNSQWATHLWAPKVPAPGRRFPSTCSLKICATALISGAKLTRRFICHCSSENCSTTSYYQAVPTKDNHMRGAVQGNRTACGVGVLGIWRQPPCQFLWPKK